MIRSNNGEVWAHHANPQTEALLFTGAFMYVQIAKAVIVYLAADVIIKACRAGYQVVKERHDKNNENNVSENAVGQSH